MNIVFYFDKFLFFLFLVNFLNLNHNLFAKRRNNEAQPSPTKTANVQQHNSTAIILRKEELEALIKEATKATQEQFITSLREIEKEKLIQKQEKEKNQKIQVLLDLEEQAYIKNNQKKIQQAEEKRIKKEIHIEEKIKNNEKLTKYEDLHFNKGKQRGEKLNTLVKILYNQGKNLEAEELESFLKKPKKNELSVWSQNYFKLPPKNSDDFIDYKTIELINSTAHICYQLEWLPLGCRYISIKLAKMLVLNDDSLNNQIQIFDHENEIEKAYNLLTIGNALNEIGRNFITVFQKLEKNNYLDDNKFTLSETREKIQYLFDSITHIINYPFEFTEKIIWLTKPIIETQTSGEVDFDCTKLGNTLITPPFNYKICNIEKACKLASLGLDSLLIGMHYGYLFTPHVFENWPTSIPNEIIQERKKQLAELVSTMQKSFNENELQNNHPAVSLNNINETFKANTLKKLSLIIEMHITPLTKTPISIEAILKDDFTISSKISACIAKIIRSFYKMFPNDLAKK